MEMCCVHLPKKKFITWRIKIGNGGVPRDAAGLLSDVNDVSYGLPRSPAVCLQKSYWGMELYAAFNNMVLQWVNMARNPNATT
jgi:hypothetical protein